MKNFLFWLKYNLFDWRRFRWWFQRRIRGWDNRDLWGLDFTFIKFIYPRLKLFRETSIGMPGNIYFDCGEDDDKAREKWNSILDEMLEGFKLAISSESYPLMDEDHEKLERSMDLFREYFFALWD